MPTSDQVVGYVRLALAVLGTIATTFGWLTPDAVGALTAKILAIVGPVMNLVSLIWVGIANSPSSIIASATKMPEVNSDKLAAAISDPALKKVATENGTS